MSLKYFFNPKSVAVIGASSDKVKIGRQVLDNIIAGGFKGIIFPINLREDKVAGFKAYPSLDKLPHSEYETLLVVIAIPVQFVLSEVIKCAQLGIKNIIIITAGFKEAGDEGKKLELEIASIASRHHLHILGPNCLGLINTWHKLNATFASADTATGSIALLSQSGAVGSAALDWLKVKDFNFGYFISLGNKAVLDENKIIDYLATDNRIDLVVAYLEEIKDGEKFMSLVSRLAKKKPVAILKAGQSAAGGQLALSHTGSLAGSNAAVETGVKRSGAIWLENLEELFSLLLLFRKESCRSTLNQELYVMTNAGGVAVLTVDEISRQNLPFGRSWDLLGDADAARYENGLKVMLADKKINNLLVLLTPQTSTEPLKTAEAIIAYAKKYPKKLIMTSFVGGEAIAEARDLFEKNNIPTFDYPEEAVRSFKKLISYKKTLSTIKEYKVPKVKIKSPLTTTDYLKSLEFLREYGIETVKTVKYDKNKVASYKYPVVLKAIGPDFLHKTDKNAVIVNLKNETALRSAVSLLEKQNKTALINRNNYLIISEMASHFQEIILGFKRDVSFGPIMMIGLGGIYAEVFKEVKLATSDLDIKQASEVIADLRIYPILNGARGKKKYDTKSLAKALVNLSKIANEHPEIKEFDINPMFIFEKGCQAGDVRIIV
ncbi:MAG: acetate--CoA ligase family protein [Patescibacteria group bacterium]